MRRGLLGYLILATLGIILGCSNLGHPADSVEIRISNRSAEVFERVTVTFPTGKVDYGRVEGGEASEYQRVEQAYRIALIEVLANGRELSLRPQDYMGETPLPPGRYTYELSFAAASGELHFGLIED